MIPEVGSFALAIALVFALLLGTIPLAGLKLNHEKWINAARIYVFGQFIAIAFAYLCLVFCFITDDFTVGYVLMNSSVSLPWFYKFCAVWGGHEGSMLLWVSLLSLWILGVNFFSQSLGAEIRARALIVLGWLSAGFILFLLSTSNPFARQFQILGSKGRDLNPLLQDPGFLFHPPMLYMGYVGFSVAFALAIAVLWLGKNGSSWSKWTRPWTLAAWCCLTTGITLGSWWAYRELGWGGWWFWDPVENASFMPWLAGTALIHALMVSEKRQLFQGWTILLAITAFALSLIGTFLVRSGVVTSVHAFAVDPKRGLYILGLLCVVIGGALVLFAARIHRLLQPTRTRSLSLCSRESFLFLNNVLLIVLMLTILLGTTYPMLMDGLGLGKLSVGAPYFNHVFIPLVVPLLIMIGAAGHIKWQHDSFHALFSKLKWEVLISPSLAGGILYVTVHALNLSSWCGLTLAFWIIFTTLKSVWCRFQAVGVVSMGQTFWGMILAHIGVAMTVIGITVSSQYGTEKDVVMTRGETVELANYQFHWVSEKALKGPNYHGMQATFHVKHKNDKNSRVIYPEKRSYDIAEMSMTEAAIDVSPFRDLYVALGEPFEESAWSVRLYYKPFVRWIWGGGLMMLFGGLLSLTDRRYYQKKGNARVVKEAHAYAHSHSAFDKETLVQTVPAEGRY